MRGNSGEEILRKREKRTVGYGGKTEGRKRREDMWD